MAKKVTLNDKIYPKKSALHGTGLFAKQKIKSGEIIGQIAANPTQESGLHVLWVSENEQHKVTGPLKYINHSAQPNACYYDDLSVVALRTIYPDDEITHNYGDDWIAE